MPVLSFRRRLTRVATDEGIINYLYDDVTGQLKSTWTGDFAVNTAPGILTRTDYDYDRLGRLSEVHAVKQNGADAGTTTYEYDAVGNLVLVTTVTASSATTYSHYDYDELNRLRVLTHSRETGTTPGYSGDDELNAKFNYEVRTDGKRTGVTETIYDANGAHKNIVTWTYDNLGRLTSEYFDGEGADHDFIDVYTYDLVGNRLKKEHDADPGFTGISQPSDLLGTTPNFTGGTGDETIDYTYDDNDRLYLETSSVNGVTDYNYNEAGELTQKDDPVSGVTNYHYDVRGRLIGIDTAGDGIDDISYEYNASGTRVSVEEGGVKTRHLVEENNPTGYAQVLEEWTDSNTNEVQDPGELLRSYVFGHDVLAQWAAANTLYYLLYDGHGSTRGLVDAMGQPLDGQIYAYDAFGNRLTGMGLVSGTPLTNLLYSGEQTDPTGLQYLRARYYNPANGRFNRLDPATGILRRPLTLQTYSYAGLDPINAIDPSGESFIVSISVSSAIHASVAGLTFGAISGGYSYARGASVGQAFLAGLRTAGLTGFAFLSPAFSLSLLVTTPALVGLNLYSGNLSAADAPEM